MNNKNFGPQQSKTNAQQVRQQNQQSAQRQTGPEILVPSLLLKLVAQHNNSNKLAKLNAKGN